MKKNVRGLLLALAAAAAVISGCSAETGMNSAEMTGEQPLSSAPSDTRPSSQEPEKQTPPEKPETEKQAEAETDTPPEKPSWEEDENQEASITIIQATDIHYLAQSLTDNGTAFMEMTEHGDGKLVPYVREITEAFLDQVIRIHPDALILSGDLTLEGEKESHEELAEALYQVKNQGIPVLVIPGNHDINNHKAAKYAGDGRMPAEYATPQEFLKIYQDFGYNDAISEDVKSLSYVYQLDEKTRLMMLDTCQYRPISRVGGVIENDTYDWIEEQLEEAWNEGINVIPVAHHNLLEESQVYVDDCTIEHSSHLINMLENWDVPFFLSGHLHVQHNMRSEENRGIWEMVTSSLSTPVCQYGVIRCWDDGSFSYHTSEVDVERWARETGREEEELLHFNSYKEDFLRRVFYNQSQDNLEGISQLSSQQKDRMSQLYSDLNYAYYQGSAWKIREQILADPAYQLWLEDGSLSVLAEYMGSILSDANRDYNELTGP